MSAIEAFLDQLLRPAISFLLVVNAAGVVEVLLYGIHIVLFCVCMFILARNRRSTQWFIAISAVTMFVLSTADVALTIHLLTHDLDAIFINGKLPTVLKRIGYKNPLFVTNNFIADLVLVGLIVLLSTDVIDKGVVKLYRCYMVWGRSKYILIGASCLVLADTIWGYTTMGVTVSLLSASFIPVYVWTIFTINLLLAIVTVARIFWVSKMAEPLLGQTRPRGYRMAMAVIMESSVVYSACILAYIKFPRPSPYRIVTVTACYRLVTIMPTLLIVQIGLGRIMRDTTNIITTTSEFDVEPGRATNSIVLDTLVLSTHNTYPIRSVNEDGNHPFDSEIRGPLTSPNVSMSHQETDRSSLLENPTSQ